MRPCGRLGELGGGWGGWWRLVRLATGLLVAVGCSKAPSTTSRTSSNLPQPVLYDPAHDLGQLFHDVQLSGIFKDSKTFADARPRFAPAEIIARYASARGAPQFNLQAFVQQHFELPRPVGEGFRSDTSQTMEQHIRALWPVLTRPPDSADAHSSLIPLPNPYVVPGGRFREVYYWDSYFTMLGLVASGRTDLVKSMLDNFAHLIGTVGHIPNGNRTYYLSRSQPPFFAAMVGLYARATDTTQALPYLDALEAEHAFWMNGAERLAPGAGQAYRRVVRLSDGGPLLNRYWDDRADPRPESYRPDYEVGQTLADARREGFYRNVRATAESGLDFSSRWTRDPRARSRRRRPARAGVLEARRIRHDVDRLRPTVGRPQRMAALGVVDDRGRSPLRARGSGGCRPRPVARAEPPHLSVDRQNDGKVRRGRCATVGRRRRVRDAGWVRVDERRGAGARQNA